MYQIRHHLRMPRFFSVPEIMALVSLASEELLSWRNMGSLSTDAIISGTSCRSSRAFWAGGRVFSVPLQ